VITVLSDNVCYVIMYVLFVIVCAFTVYLRLGFYRCNVTTFGAIFCCMIFFSLIYKKICFYYFCVQFSHIVCMLYYMTNRVHVGLIVTGVLRGVFFCLGKIFVCTYTFVHVWNIPAILLLLPVQMEFHGNCCNSFIPLCIVYCMSNKLAFIYLFLSATLISINYDLSAYYVYTLFRKNTHLRFLVYLYGKCSDLYKIFRKCLGGKKYSIGGKNRYSLLLVPSC